MSLKLYILNSCAAFLLLIALFTVVTFYSNQFRGSRKTQSKSSDAQRRHSTDSIKETGVEAQEANGLKSKKSLSNDLLTELEHNSSFSFTQDCINKLRGYIGRKIQDQLLISAARNEFANYSTPVSYNAKLCTEDIIMVYGFKSCEKLRYTMSYIVENFWREPWFNHERIYRGINASLYIGCWSSTVNVCAFAGFPREKGYEEYDEEYNWRNQTICENHG